jgi:hydrogenase maturation factor
MSRLHCVVSMLGDADVAVRDLEGRLQAVSLLAYDGPPLKVGDWLVAQSGFALAPADAEEAVTALSELQAFHEREGR